MYDPAARGTIVEETEEDERGEAFGLYSSAQMGGFIFGPVIGAVGAAVVGSFAFAFVAAGVGCIVAFAYLVVAFHPRPRAARDGGRVAAHAARSKARTPSTAADSPEVAQRAASWPGERSQRVPGTAARALEPPASAP